MSGEWHRTVGLVESVRLIGTEERRDTGHVWERGGDANNS